MDRYIEILDTTLRDGEQTDNVSFLPSEKLTIARGLLQDVKVDRVEVASARVSEGEKEAVSMICRWAKSAGMLDRVEVLGFLDGGKSVDWLVDCGCKRINLLCKGSLRHCQYQLNKTPEEHIADIIQTIEYATAKGVSVNIYLEDWSNGMIDSPDYVFQMMEAIVNGSPPKIGGVAAGRGGMMARKGGMKSNVERIMLPDTLGVLNPLQVLEFVRKMVKRYPKAHFDFHAHNDYDLAISNVLAAVLSGCQGIHATVNGLGERAGNAPLASVQAILHDQFKAHTNIDEAALYKISRLVESYSAIPISPNKPIVGESVFTQVAGVHADGDNKHNLYQNNLKPERFGRKREYALGKNSGKANIIKNLDALGLELTPEQTKLVTERITELGDRKEIVTPDDLPFIVNDVIKHNADNNKVKLVGYMVSTARSLRSYASLRIEIDGVEYEAASTGDGQYDAFVKGLHKIYTEKLHREFPVLTNYFVTIPPGGRTDALVQTVISWEYKGKSLRTRGLDADQTDSAIKATIKMLNAIENM
ncbi:MAG: 2-isopropylmalate synthase [Bacteroidaceae bacterium]|nr:2-isopropylmalate synthase [Bacteroidaceae bacterium]